MAPVASFAKVRPSSGLTTEAFVTDLRRTRRLALAIVIVAALVGVSACAPGTSTTPGTPSTTAPGAGASAAAAATETETPTPTARPTATPKATAAPDVAVRVVAKGLTAPVGLVPIPGDTADALVLDQTGLISVLDLEDGGTTTFLDLRDRVVPLMPDYDERGLLGLAFHPDFARNGRLFVYYGAPVRNAGRPSRTTPTRSASSTSDPAHPTSADPASERTILQFGQPQFNHSGGALGFGPDGMLYLGTGDGGGQGDASPGHSDQGNAQDLTKLNGKILRLDVDGEGAVRGPGRQPVPWPARRGRRSSPTASAIPGASRGSPPARGGSSSATSATGGSRRSTSSPPAATTAGGSVRAPTASTSTLRSRSRRPARPPAPTASRSSTRSSSTRIGRWAWRSSAATSTTGSAIPALRDHYVFADFSADPTNDLSRPLGSLLVATPAADDAAWTWGRLTVAGGPLNRFVTGMGEDAAGRAVRPDADEPRPDRDDRRGPPAGRARLVACDKDATQRRTPEVRHARPRCESGPTMNTRPSRTRPAATPPPHLRQRPTLWSEPATEEIHLITFEWATRAGKQTVVYVDRRRLD